MYFRKSLELHEITRITDVLKKNAHDQNEQTMNRCEWVWVIEMSWYASIIFIQYVMSLKIKGHIGLL